MAEAEARPGRRAGVDERRSSLASIPPQSCCPRAAAATAAAAAAAAPPPLHHGAASAWALHVGPASRASLLAGPAPAQTALPRLPRLRCCCCCYCCRPSPNRCSKQNRAQAVPLRAAAPARLASAAAARSTSHRAQAGCPASRRPSRLGRLAGLHGAASSARDPGSFHSPRGRGSWPAMPSKLSHGAVLDCTGMSLGTS